VPRPLDGLLVLDFSQFLAGPSATLRMADLGARVIKIERPDGGDLGRQLYISNLELDGDSTLFHSINRNKESFAADLKKEPDRDQVRALLRRADVMVQNFRPGVIEKLGFDYETVKQSNARIVYGEVTGYGSKGPWRGKPGQDLLVQSLSGLPWLNGDADQPPVPFGLAVVDLFAGAHLVQGILAALVRRGMTGEGGKVEVSLLESILDAQFEVLTTYMNNGHQLPLRSQVNNAHAFLGAPYGIYRTADGFLALGMGSVVRLGQLLGSEELLKYDQPEDLFDCREQIKTILSELFQQRPTGHWLSILEPADVWCADVFDWNQLFAHEGFKVLDMVQRVKRRDGVELDTTRCPIRLDGQVLKSTKGAPRLGADTEHIRKEFSLT
jgi:CoA:oxalate CoA-transferase